MNRPWKVAPAPKVVNVKDYLEKLVEKEVNRERTFDEILAPFRDAVEKSGISDEDLGALFREARKEVSKERREVVRG